jgi:hypothetical protein
MNTREINGSSWRIKYYFITALPLTVTTVFLPLLILPIFNFMVRHVADNGALRNVIKWSWIIFTFIANLILDVLSRTPAQSADDFVNAQTALFCIESVIAFPFAVNIYSEFSRRRKNEGGLAIIYENRWWILFWAFALGSFFTSYYAYTFVELPPYIIYFGFIWIRHRRKKSRNS